ncbi:hypothetical protein KDA_47110 [Dictyobacter alpinus]|uniref:HTH cro/C1-type domain-containing protein n=1 Tax=Dictyobacter alpinus TaxID=2014873 RepID=A0A402BD71_9CHLR|nr:hypothetical protein [Dictyobacter alpinus]GCE29227.1 hypothetical protein KDA_47110 [Dictyobacter alpinus]
MEETQGEKKKRDPLMKAQYAPNLKLKRERELRGWSQALVAEQIGAQSNLITRWETGAAFPSPYYRQKLCTLFEKDAAYLGLIKGDADSAVSELHKDVPVPHVQQTDQEVGSVVQGEQVSEPPVRGTPAVGRRTLILSGLGGVALSGIIGWRIWWLGGVVKTSASSLPGEHAPSNPLRYRYTPQADVFVNDVAWSPNGTQIVCAVGDNTAQILDGKRGTVIRVYRGHKDYVNCAQWAADGIRVASASADKTAQIWSVATGTLLTTYTRHQKSVLYLAWSHSGTMVASGSRDGKVHVWDAFTGEKISIYTGHAGSVWSIRWSPDDKSVVSGGDDGIIHVWEPVEARPSADFHYVGPATSGINEVDWAPNGKWIVSAHGDGHVSIWDALTGTHVLTYPEHKAVVRTARWSPSGTLIASGGADTAIHVWNAVTGKRLLQYQQQTNDILEVSWSPDSNQLASASKDKSMVVYAVDAPHM